jgi:hypothetical protein
MDRSVRGGEPKRGPPPAGGYFGAAEEVSCFILVDFLPVSALMPELLDDSAGVFGMAAVSVALGAGAGAGAAVVSVGFPGTAPVSPLVPAFGPQPARVARTAQGKASVCHLIVWSFLGVSAQILLAKRT